MLLSVIADTNPFNPLARCAISKAVHRAVHSGLGLSDAELCWLAYMERPIAIDFMISYFKKKEGKHNLKTWKRGLDKVMVTYSAHSLVAGMDTEYYSHWTNTTTTRGKLVLPYIHHVFTTVLTRTTFKAACKAFKPDFRGQSMEANAALLLSECHLSSASNYKPYHAVRTVACAKGLLPPVTKDNDPTFAAMSDVVVDMRKWFYPASVTTIQQARLFIESEVRSLCRELGVDGVGGDRVESMLRAFSRGDEACLMCEGSHCLKFTSRDVSVMEECVRLGLHQTWRQKATFSGGGKQGQPSWSVTEDDKSGCFCGPVRSMRALIQHMRKY